MKAIWFPLKSASYPGRDLRFLVTLDVLAMAVPPPKKAKPQTRKPHPTKTPNHFYPILLRRICPIFSGMDLTTEVQACMPFRVFYFIGVHYIQKWVGFSYKAASCLLPYLDPSLYYHPSPFFFLFVETFFCLLKRTSEIYYAF